MNLFPNGIKGLSDSAWSGVVGSAFRLVGIDLHSSPGLIKVHQKLAKNSGATVDELCKHSLAVSDGSTLWFSSESGKVWRESAGAWTLKHATVPTTGEAKCLGAHEFEHWAYWATENYVHRIHVDDLNEDWTSFVYENYLPFVNGDDEAHPMLEQNLDLFIGDKTVISKIAAPPTADANPSGTLSTELSASVKWLSLGFLINPSGLAFPSVRTSVREAYPEADTFAFGSLVVGGGGGGGSRIGDSNDSRGGGGGAGGFVQTSHTGVSNGLYAITVGGGGAGGAGGFTSPGSNGSPSSIGSLVTALGGGGGGSASVGANGASGGGGGGDVSADKAGGAGTAGQGSNGGAGKGIGDNNRGGGGGGGGAGGAGANGSGTNGGAGGAGLSSSISGSAVTYASGGAGGGDSAGNGAAGTANRGNGGEGGVSASGGGGGNGGSGIVIISYPTGSMTATGGTIATAGGNTIHTFTSSGTFAILRSTLARSVTVPSGHAKALFVITASYNDVAVSGVTFDGDAMSLEFSGAEAFGGGPTITYAAYRLLNPAAKTGDVVVTWENDTSDMLFHAFVCDGVDQTTPITGSHDNSGTSATASLTLDSTEDFQLRVATLISETATYTADGTATTILTGANNYGNDATKYRGTSTAGTLVDTTFNIKAPERITTLFGFDVDALVGTKVEGRNLARVLRWDTASESWSAEDVVEENGVNAFIRDDNYVYVQTGEFGKLFFYNGEKLEPFTRIPGEWSPSKRAVIHQGAVATHLGVPVFGLSNLEGDPALQGVYSFGSYSKDYPKVLDLSFPISSGAFGGVSIGAVLAVGADLFAAWKDAGGAGVDKLDYSNKYASAYIETMMLSGSNDRGILKTALEARAYYASLPASTGITFGYKKKYEADYAALTPKTDSKLCAVKANASIPEVANLQLKFGFTASGNGAPEIEDFDYELAPLKK